MPEVKAMSSEQGDTIIDVAVVVETSPAWPSRIMRLLESFEVQWMLKVIERRMAPVLCNGGEGKPVD